MYTRTLILILLLLVQICTLRGQTLFDLSKSTREASSIKAITHGLVYNVRNSDTTIIHEVFYDRVGNPISYFANEGQNASDCEIQNFYESDSILLNSKSKWTATDGFNYEGKEHVCYSYNLDTTKIIGSKIMRYIHQGNDVDSNVVDSIVINWTKNLINTKGKPVNEVYESYTSLYNKEMASTYGRLNNTEYKYNSKGQLLAEKFYTDNQPKPHMHIFKRDTTTRFTTYTYLEDRPTSILVKERDESYFLDIQYYPKSNQEEYSFIYENDLKLSKFSQPTLYPKSSLNSKIKIKVEYDENNLPVTIEHYIKRRLYVTEHYSYKYFEVESN